MSDSKHIEDPPRPVGRLTEEGELYLPPEDDGLSSPGGALEDGTTTGTTGRIDFPGAEEPLDDDILPYEPEELEDED